MNLCVRDILSLMWFTKVDNELSIHLQSKDVRDKMVSKVIKNHDPNVLLRLAACLRNILTDCFESKKTTMKC